MGTLVNLPDGVLGVGQLALTPGTVTPTDEMCMGLVHGALTVASGAVAVRHSDKATRTAAAVAGVTEGAKTCGYLLAHAGAAPWVSSSLILGGSLAQIVATGMATANP